MLLDADDLLGNNDSQLFGSPSESGSHRSAHQQITHEWWREARHRFDVYISEAVLAEIRAGDPDAAARRLAIVDGLPILALNEDFEFSSMRMTNGSGLGHVHGQICLMWPSPSPMPWIIWLPGIVPTLPTGRLFVGSKRSMESCDALLLSLSPQKHS